METDPFIIMLVTHHGNPIHQVDAMIGWKGVKGDIRAHWWCSSFSIWNAWDRSSSLLLSSTACRRSACQPVRSTSLDLGIASSLQALTVAVLVTDGGTNSIRVMRDGQCREFLCRAT